MPGQMGINPFCQIHSLPIRFHQFEKLAERQKNSANWQKFAELAVCLLTLCQYAEMT